MVPSAVHTSRQSIRKITAMKSDYRISILTRRRLTPVDPSCSSSKITHWDYHLSSRLTADSSSSHLTLLLIYFEHLQIIDGNDTRQYALGSAIFRPPVIVIQGNRLIVRFFANGARASGYRATYSFFNGMPS